MKLWRTRSDFASFSIIGRTPCTLHLAIERIVAGKGDAAGGVDRFVQFQRSPAADDGPAEDSGAIEPEPVAVADQRGVGVVRSAPDA